SKTKQAFNVQIISKGDAKGAFEDAMSIIVRACKTGFTNSELERVNSQIIANYEALYNERDKTKTSSIAQELIRNFIDNEPAPGIEIEYQLISQNLPAIPVEMVNAFASQLLTPQNEVVVVSQPKTEGSTLPERETMMAALNSILNAQYEAYVDEVITEPLITKMPAPGKIKSESANAEFGTTEFRLSNGVKVVVKPTDFAADEIMLNMSCEGGKRYYPASQADNILALEDAYDSCNFGPFDNNQLRKYLSGKKVSLGLVVGLSTLAFEGQSTIKDFPTLMELLYTSFVGLTPNQKQYDVTMEKVRKMLELQANNPQMIFSRTQSAVEWGNNPVMATPDVSTVDNASYPEMMKILKDVTSNAANYTLVITGNVDINSLRPLLEQYVASLPSKGQKDTPKELNPIAIAQGDITKTVETPMQTPMVVVYDNYNGDNLEYNVRNKVMLELFADVLDNKFIATLREEEGGTYGASVGTDLLPASGQWRLIYYFQTGDEMAQRLIDRAHKETLALMANGTDATEFGKVREAAVKQYELSLRKNSFWLTQLCSIERGYNLLSGHEEFLKNVTLEDFNSYIKTMYNGKNRIQVILEGKAEK
ncbi:MAG: insulinase family protein, partial [Muribaculaceae bacterium]|nr:insulinase family protein [Muribaculaceae bacterium]